MPPAIAEGIKLFGIAQIEMRLLAHPFAQTLFQGALRAGIEGAERQGVLTTLMRHHQRAWPLALDRNDRRRQTDADCAGAHRFTSGKAVVTPSATCSGCPITETAVTMRPPR